MTVLFVILLFSICLGIDYFRTRTPIERGTMYTTPGYEFLGALAQDGGDKLEVDGRPANDKR